MGTGLPRAPRYSFDLVTHLVARELRLRYRRAVLGWLWVVAEPLARLVTLAFVFGEVLPQGIPDFAVYLFTGILAWTFFAGAVGSVTASAVDRSALLFRPGLPRPTVAVVSALTDAVDYLAALPLLLLFIAVGPGIPATALALPVALGVQLLLVLGLGFAFCAANVYLRDVRLFVNVSLLLGFYLTPIFYSVDQVPERFRWVIDLNPMARLLEVQRNLLLYGNLPDAGPALLLTLTCVAVFAAGYAVYRAASPSFVDEL